MSDDKRHPRGGLYFEDFEVGRTYQAPLFPDRHADGQHAVLQHDAQSAAAAYRPALLRDRNRMGPAADELAVHARSDDRHVGQRPLDRHHHRQSRHAGDQFPHPVFENDTLHATTEILGKRESKSRPNAGIVELLHRCFNQDDKLVAECRRQAFIKKRPVA